MSQVLVTGGAGFIGSALTRHLLSLGHDVVVLDALTYAGLRENLTDVLDGERCRLIEGSIGDTSLVRDLLHCYRPKLVVNAAAETHVDRSLDSAARFFATNVGEAAALAETCCNYWLGLDGDRAHFRFVQVSTDEVYGPVVAGAADETAPLRPTSPYAASKAGGELAVMAFYLTHGLPIIVTRGSNTYGARQFPEKLIPLMVLSALSRRDLPIYGDGLHQRDWLHVDDHVTGIVAAATRGVAGETYNLGSGVTTANMDVVRAICAIIDARCPPSDKIATQSRITHVDDRPGHDRRYMLDCSKAGRDLSWAPAARLFDGLAETVQWYIANRAWWGPIISDSYDLSRLGRAGGEAS